MDEKPQSRLGFEKEDAVKAARAEFISLLMDITPYHARSIVDVIEKLIDAKIAKAEDLVAPPNCPEER
jgi:hypothetical protein